MTPGRATTLRVCALALLVAVGAAVRISGGRSGAMFRDSSDDSSDLNVSEMLDHLGGEEVPDTALGRQFRALKRKMLILTTEDLEAAVSVAAADAGVPSGELAELVYQASHYGNLQSLNNLLGELIHTGTALYIDKETAGLGDVLAYLAAKNKIPNMSEHGMDPIDFFLECPYDASEFERCKSMVGNKDRYIIVLDTILMRKASADTPEGRALKKNLMALSQHDKVKFLAPLGWGMGLNLFNQLEYKEIIKRLAVALKETLAVKERGAFLIEEHEHQYVEDVYHASYGEMEPGRQAVVERHMMFTRILMSNVRSKLEQWAEEEGLERVPDVMVHFNDKMDSDEYTAIADFDDDGLFSESELDDSEMNIEAQGNLFLLYATMELAPMMPTFREYQRAVRTVAGCGSEDEVAAGMEKDGHFLSMNNLVRLSRDIHLAMVEEAFEPDLYFIPGTTPKSFTMATMIHLTVNELDPWKVQTLAGIKRISKERAGDRHQTKIVILDDYAGSGDSLMDENISMLTRREQMGGMVDFAVAPLIQSAMATKLFTEGTRDSGPLKTFPGRMINSVTTRGDTPPPWFGGPGYGDGFYLVSLGGYMSPDNNCYFAQMHMAPLFVSTAHGVKRTDSYSPTCSSADRLKLFFKHIAKNQFVAHEVMSTTEPICTEFAFQFYCGQVKKFGRRSRIPPDVNMNLARLKRALAEGHWEYGFENSEKPTSPECVMEAVDVLVEKGFFRKSEGGTMKISNFPAVCNMLNYNPEVIEWDNQVKYLRESAHDAGLFGFEWAGF